MYTVSDKEEACLVKVLCYHLKALKLLVQL